MVKTGCGKGRDSDTWSWDRKRGHWAMWMNSTPVKHWTTCPCTSSESRALQDTSTHLFFEKVDTTNFCSLEKLVLHNFSVKKQILERFMQIFVVRKSGHYKVWGEHYTIVYWTLQNRIQTLLGTSMIQARLCAHVRTLMQKSHASQTETPLPFSSHNHHLNNGLPPQRSLVTPITTNMPGRPQTTTTACQQNTTTTCPRHQRQRQRMRPPHCPLPRHATPTTNKHGCPKYNKRPIDTHTQRRQQAANDVQHPTNNTDCPATTKTTNNGCRITSACEWQCNQHPQMTTTCTPKAPAPQMTQRASGSVS